MNENKFVSNKFSINWIAASLFLFFFAALFFAFLYFENSWLYTKNVLNVAWDRQLAHGQRMMSNWQAILLNGSVLIVVVIIVIEHIWPWRKRQKRFRKGFRLDLLYAMFAFALFNLLGGSAAFALVVIPFNDFLANVLNIQYPIISVIDEVPIWMRIGMLVLASELSSYWAHRLQHNVDFLWQIHKIHHSSLELDVMNAQRLHWLEVLWLSVFGYVTLGIAGFNVSEIFVINVLTYFLCYFTHANVYIPIGKLKYVINSPQMHIWHHAIDIDPNRNVNYGSALSVWDWIFGTAYMPGKAPDDLRLGFEGVEDFPTTFLGQFMYPFRVFGKSLRRILTDTRSIKTDDQTNTDRG